MQFAPLKTNLVHALCLGLPLLCLLGLTLPARANDHIFPPAASAKAAIDFDRHGFLIHGQRTFIVSAGMEYARVPQALWRDRLLRLKRAGFNCVEVYTFWNWHEPQEGKFDFSGDHDLDAYLKLVHAMGMYAICRVGPYYCAEWDSGGYPLWLRFKPGLRVREDNAPFLSAVDQFFGKLIPIVAANQINRGGSVILVQLENEGASWGTDEANPYFTHLRTQAVSLGLEVPYFFSGLHHGSDPGSDTAMDDPNRPNPWFTTEFWSVWYSQYGPKEGDAATYDRRTLKIIAHGGGGYNYYMAYGGTNFAYTNNNEDAASYDYGAAVGQAGDLRPIYYAMKRDAWFARSFQDILTDSTDATDDYKNAATNPAVHVTARRSPAGTIVFLDNPGGSPVQTQVKGTDGRAYPEAGPLTLTPGEIRPVVTDTTLAPSIRLTQSTARIFGIARQGNVTTVVVYGPAGEPGELRFHAGRTDQTIPITFAPDRFTESLVTAGGPETVRVLAVPSDQADRVWFVDVAGQTQIVCGPSFVGDADMVGGRLRLAAEKPWQEATAPVTTVYGPAGPALQLAAPLSPLAHPASPALSAWQARDASQPASPGYDDHAWLSSAAPMQMGADGDLTADAWYRAAIVVPTAGTYSLNTAGGDRAEVFVDGKPAGSGRVHDGIPLTLPAGRHALAVFTAHDGRDKMFGYTGPLTMNDPKGLVGPTTLQRGGGVELINWRVLKAANADAVKAGPPDAGAAGWQAYKVGDDAFGHQSGYAWFQTTLPASVGASHANLHFGSVDDNGTVFVNGKQIATHNGWDSAFNVPLTPGPAAVLTVFIQNVDGTGGLGKPVLFSSQLGEGVTVGAWKMRGGPGDPLSPAGWKRLGAADAFRGPVFFRATFAAPPPAATGPHPIWRVLTAGLGHGSVWVNGHNLGRYPEKIPINGLYVPECWLQAGRNSLVIYDEDGHHPDRVTVAAEAAASRDVVEISP